MTYMRYTSKCTLRSESNPFKSSLSFCLFRCKQERVVNDFHRSKPHDIYSHDGCIIIERNSIRSLRDQMTTFTIMAELINMEDGNYRHSCPFHSIPRFVYNCIKILNLDSAHWTSIRSKVHWKSQFFGDLCRFLLFWTIKLISLKFKD